MKVYKTIKMPEETVEKIYCDICEEEIEELAQKHQEYIHVSKRWGYHSPWDGEVHEFDICQKCYEKLLKNLKKKA